METTLVRSISVTDFPLIRSLTLLIISLLSATIIRFIFENVLTKLLKKTKTEADDKIIVYAKEPVFWSVILVGSFFTALSLDPSGITIDYIKKILITIAILIWLNSLIKISNTILTTFKKRFERKGISADAVPFLKNILNVTIVILAIFLLLDNWGINITPLLASAGVAGLAVAFAAKDTVANLFGGISVFFDKPYKVGDYVIIDDKYRGEVMIIGLRSTKIKTRDNVLLTVPNSVMVTNAVINETGFDPKLRIRIPLGVSYNSDLEKVESVLIDEIGKHKKVLKEPVPRVRFRKFGDSSIELEVLGLINTPPERGKTVHELIKNFHKRLMKENIEIPFPQRDIHLINHEN